MNEEIDLQKLVEDCANGDFGVNKLGERPSRITVYGGNGEMRQVFCTALKVKLKYNASVGESDSCVPGVYGINLGEMARSQAEARRREAERGFA
ncbi:MAG: hypothetical protein KKB21_04600 [Nanoarchaeota archaeon]|nr:hypothetical protein [Nanoarchaeota archaeon]MBU4086826.1 hypothetical protein [Nanoarchaeota archaeon]